MKYLKLDRAPVLLDAREGQDPALWDTLIELAELRQGEWTLIGGQMVHLHGLEHGVNPPRFSMDLDVLVNARVVAAVPSFVNEIRRIGFVLDGSSPDGLAHRYLRENVSLDVLAPEGLGKNTDLTTTPPGHTLQVPGGTQALVRTELLPIKTKTRSGFVPRPSLLGALVGKAMAVDLDDEPDNQRLDFAFLLSLVGDPFDLKEELTSKDKNRLKKRAELLNPSHRIWRRLTTEQANNAKPVLEILTN